MNKTYICDTGAFSFVGLLSTGIFLNSVSDMQHKSAPESNSATDGMPAIWTGMWGRKPRWVRFLTCKIANVHTERIAWVSMFMGRPDDWAGPPLSSLNGRLRCRGYDPLD
jgi:hypothetical protein